MLLLPKLPDTFDQPHHPYRNKQTQKLPSSEDHLDKNLLFGEKLRNQCGSLPIDRKITDLDILADNSIKLQNKKIKVEQPIKTQNSFRDFETEKMDVEHFTPVAQTRELWSIKLYSGIVEVLKQILMNYFY